MMKTAVIWAPQRRPLAGSRLAGGQLQPPPADTDDESSPARSGLPLLPGSWTVTSSELACRGIELLLCHILTAGLPADDAKTSNCPTAAEAKPRAADHLTALTAQARPASWSFKPR
jgi:hypothetical protein